MALSVNKRKIGATIVAGSLMATWITLIINNDGISSAQVELNDGGVWVTNLEKQQVAHLNYPAFTLDSTVRTDAARFDIAQTADSILFHNQDASEVAPIDPAYVAFEDVTALESASVAAMGGQTVATYDPTKGDVWATDFTAVSSVRNDENLLPFNVPMGALAVSTSGSVVGVSAESKTWFNGESSIAFPSEISEDANLQISTVGDQSVLLDSSSKTLYFESGHSTSLSGEQLTLQLPGPDADFALVATTAGLFEVPIGDEDTEVGPVVFLDQSGAEVDATLAATASDILPGNPANPAFHQGCAYAAWSGSGRFVRDCAGDEKDVAQENQGLQYAEQPRFRVNRDVIVLNDVTSGNVWLPDDDLMLIDNWDLITTNDPSADEESEERSNTLSEQPEDPELQEENIAPIAEDDTFGARAGATAVLPVLNNDSDENGDILTVALENSPAGADVVPIRGATAFQITFPEDATESVTFRYRAMDGRGGEDTASVTVNVHPRGQNGAPEQVHQTRAKIAQQGRVSIETLGDWVDPDGDPIFLEAVENTEGLEIRYKPNGTVELIDSGLVPGLVQVPIFVSDGTEAGKGIINLEVTEYSNQPPVTNADHIVVTVGETAEVSPLVNDTDPNGDSLRLISIGTPPDGLIARASTALGTVMVSAAKVGTYYLTYAASDGTASTNGRIRIDAISPDENNLPIAEADMGVLPEGGSVLVNVLSNDYDPQGGVLTVTGVQLPENSPLRVAPVRHEMVRVIAPRGLEEPASFTYTIANSTGTATGSVLIIPAPAPDGSEPPILNPDRLVVREGDVGSVKVLDNDRSPSELELTVSPDLDHQVPASAGDVFVSDNIVRFRAGQEPGEYQVIYTVSDTRGNIASSTVTVVVVPLVEDQNIAPAPRDITARVVAGRSVAIDIPLRGIDPDGDSVTLLPDHTSPTLGTVEMNDDGTFTYTAHESSQGTDTFVYRVRDNLGAIGEARVRIGIAPAPTVNQPPIAQNDVIVVRPGARVEAPVLANDVDPDGDELNLVAGKTLTQADGLLIEEDENLVIVTAPNKPGVYSVTYQVSDPYGATARGLLTVDVRTNSPLLAPVAVDDTVPIEGTPSAVTVNVLDNDYDPDGDRDSLTVTSSDPGVTVNADKSLTIETTSQRQLILYTITDTDELSASAIVIVPPVITETSEEAEVEVPPRLVEGSLVTVDAGETAQIPINEYITPNVTITDANLVQASVGWNGEELVVSDTELAFTSAEDFNGRTSVSLEVVTDDDVVGTVTIPIEVIGTVNRPPTFMGNIIEIGAGEDPVILNLAAMAEDPDGDRLEFTLNNAPGGLDVSLSGEQLSVGAPLDHAVGGAGSIHVEVTDGEHTVEGMISVTVVASSAPLVQLSPIHEEVKLGDTVTVDIAASAVNPFPEPLTLRARPQVVGGQANVSASGTTIRITPTSQGEVTVGYLVADATGQPSRDVQGVISVSVKADPDPPLNVTARADGQNVTVAWTQGALNGGVLTGFTVVDLTQGDSRDCGLATSCVFPNRSWGEHQFHVIQTTDVGQSEPSAVASVEVDQVPAQPVITSAEANDGQLTITWAYGQPEQGSAITQVQACLVEVGSCVTVGTGTTSHTFSGLSNGNSYQAFVVVTNAVGSVESNRSAPVTPVGKPGAPRGLTHTPDASNPSHFRLSWQAPASTGGSPIAAYEVEGYDGIRTIIGPAPSAMNFRLDTPLGRPVTVKVRAYNADPATADASRISEWASYTLTLYGRADAITAAAPVASGESGTIKMGSPSVTSYSNGWTASDYTFQMRLNGGQPRTFTPVLTGLQDGTPVTVQVRPVVNPPSGSAIVGEWVTAGTATPYGPAVLPKLTCSPGGEGEIDCSWSGGSFGGMDGRAYLNISDDNKGQVSAGVSGSHVFSGRTAGKQYNICIELVQLPAKENPNQKSVTLTDCITTTAGEGAPSPPPPEPTPDPTPVDPVPSLIAPAINCTPGPGAGAASCTWGGGDEYTTAVDWFLITPGSTKWGTTVGSTGSEVVTGLAAGPNQICIRAMDNPGATTERCATVEVP